MKLTVLSNLYPPYVVGGNEMLCAEVVQALRRRGHVVSVLTGRGSRHEDPNVHGVLALDLDRCDEIFLGGRRPTHAEAWRRHYFDGPSQRATRDALRKLQPDLVVVWNLYLASLGPLVAARRYGRPVVTHVADKWLANGLRAPAAPPPGGSRLADLAFRLAGAAARPLLRRLCRPRPIVAISRFMADTYVRSGFAAADIEVQHLGVPTRDIPARDSERAPGPLRLLFVGGLWEGKGPHVALRALGRLVRAGIDARLDVCGDGTAHFVAWLRQVAREESIAERVELHGFVAPGQVRDHMARADVLVFPSLWDEPFAAVPVEAAAAGLAIVATTAGGTPEAIEDGRHGLLVPPDDPDALASALQKLAGDAPLRRQLGEAAAARARAEFDFEGYVDRLERLYAATAPADGPGSAARET